MLPCYINARILQKNRNGSLEFGAHPDNKQQWRNSKMLTRGVYNKNTFPKTTLKNVQNLLPSDLLFVCKIF